ncbi:MAG: PAS domain S-box protein [Nitrospinae bacterium]|nr:PAS domain S-box protein [Nitrospinota bacterium]
MNDMETIREQKAENPAAKERSPERIARFVTFNYMVAVTLLALFTLAIFYFLDREAREQKDIGAVINMAGRDRMFSQSILLWGARIEAAHDHVSRAHYRERMRADIAQMAENHALLTGVKSKPGFNPYLTPVLYQHYFGAPVHLDRKVKAFHRAGLAVADYQGTGPDDAEEMRLLDELAWFEQSDLRKDLDDAASLYQNESKRLHAFFHRYENLSLGLILAMLGLISFYIFRPMVRHVRRMTEGIIDSQRRLKVVTDTIGEGVFVAGVDGRITFANPEASHMLKYDIDELIGMNSAAVCSPGCDDELHTSGRETPFLRAMREGMGGRVERTSFMDRTGDCFPVTMSVAPIMERGTAIGVVVGFYDITEQIAAEERLLKAKRDAEKANEAKEQFMALVAHDLRGPLGAIFQIMSHLEANAETLSIDQARLVELSVRSVGQMLHMTEELLDIHRIKNAMANPKLADVPVRMLAVRATMILELQARNKRVRIDNQIDRNLVYRVDEELYLQVLINLISNAIKFSYAGQTIRIYNLEGREGTICVADQGMGVPEGMISHLFSREIKTSQVGSGGEIGTGLGLPLCKDIMQAHGGDIFVESTPGEGTTFFVTAPVQQGQQVA